MKFKTKQGDVLDHICWLYYGRREGVSELVLEANPGLAELGPVFDAGIIITLPELPSPSGRVHTVMLWD